MAHFLDFSFQFVELGKQIYHEWKVFYFCVRAINNKRLNQIRIFSTAELEQTHDNDDDDDNEGFCKLKTHLFGAIGSTERNYFISNLNTKLKTIEHCYHETFNPIMTLNPFHSRYHNALSSLRLSFVEQTKPFLLYSSS